MDVQAAFWGLVDQGTPDDCWEWRGEIIRGKSPGKGGYGRFVYLDRRVSAHRFAWEASRGEIPEGLWVLHRCDNRKCCNVEHLFLGTRQDNIRDMCEKGRNNRKLSIEQVAEARAFYAKKNISQSTLAVRYGVSPAAVQNIMKKCRFGETKPPEKNPPFRPRGERNKAAKLTDEKVRVIRESYIGGNITQKQLAVRYGVSQRTISVVVRGECWTHVTKPDGPA